jgi:hypothetical protein
MKVNATLHISAQIACPLLTLTLPFVAAAGGLLAANPPGGGGGGGGPVHVSAPALIS